MIPNLKSAMEAKAWIEQERANRQKFERIRSEIQTKDGLVPTEQLIVRSRDEIVLRNAHDVRVYPHWRTSGVANILLDNPPLWKLAAIRVSSNRSIVGRAPYFGVPFDKAIDVALEKGFSKSVYWLPETDKGAIYSRLFVLLTQTSQDGEPAIALEAWQWVGEGIEVDYAHMIMSNDTSTVFHLDGAVIEYDLESTITQIFDSGKRMGISKTKYFRIDGTIPRVQALYLVRGYLPAEELVDEYFEFSEEWPQDLAGQ
jgi:hypothetical protein